MFRCFTVPNQHCRSTCPSFDWLEKGSLIPCRGPNNGFVETRGKKLEDVSILAVLPQPVARNLSSVSASCELRANNLGLDSADFGI